jgi:hypothetical protein
MGEGLYIPIPKKRKPEIHLKLGSAQIGKPGRGLLLAGSAAGR